MAASQSHFPACLCLPTIKMAFPAPRHRRTGSWLSRVLGLPAPVSPAHSDSESHRSTAADVPIVTEIPTYAESSAQTESQPLERFIERVEAARKLIRGTVERVREPPIEKRRKVWKGFKSGLAEGEKKARDPASERLVQQAARPEVTVKTETKPAETAAPAFQPPSVPLSPPRVPQAPVPSPQSSSASSPSITFAREKPHIFSVPPAPPTQVTSFFVQKPVLAQDFIEDSGFAEGAEDSSNDQEEVEPAVSAPTNSLFTGNSTSVFAGSSGASVFGNSLFVGNNSIPLFGAKSASSLFAGPAQVFPASAGTSLFAAGPLFSPAAGPLQSSKPLMPTGPGNSLFAPQKNPTFQPMKPLQLDTQKKEQTGLVFASPIFTFAQGAPGQPKAQDKPQGM